MGRPRKEGMDYFPHDVDASQDEKIEAMRSMFGNDGYAFYFITLERIYRSEAGELDLNNNVIMVSLAKKIMVTQNKLKKMIDTSIEVGLFCSENFEKRKILTSAGIKKRLSLIHGLRDKWRENKGNSQSFLDGKPVRKPVENPIGNSVENAIKERKGKEIEIEKEIERKGKEMHGDAVALTAAEFDSLRSLYGPEKTQTYIDELNAYKLRTGKQYTSDYLAIKTWVVNRVKEQSEQKPQQPRDYKPPNKNATKPTMQVHIEPVVHLTDEQRKDLNDWIRKLEGGGE
jgi:hypothetical protein